MHKKLVILLVCLAAIIIGIYIQRRNKTGQNSQKSTIQYDYSVKAVEGQPIKVARVIDGDTIELINGQRLRYIGMDTPEEVDQRKPIQCFAYAAADKNRQMVEGQLITFHKDITPEDQYGRLLGFVYLADGTFVNLEMVKQGYAFAYPYPPDISKSDEFRQAEESARTARLGLWNDCRTYKTSSGREQTQAVE